MIIPKIQKIMIAAELEEGTRLNTSMVKQLTSTDPVFAEKKYKDPFSFVPSHTLVLYTNHLPKVGAKDTGIWRRLIVIPFKATVDEDVMQSLSEKDRSQAALMRAVRARVEARK